MTSISGVLVSGCVVSISGIGGRPPVKLAQANCFLKCSAQRPWSWNNETPHSLIISPSRGYGPRMAFRFLFVEQNWISGSVKLSCNALWVVQARGSHHGVISLWVVQFMIYQRLSTRRWTNHQFSMVIFNLHLIRFVGYPNGSDSTVKPSLSNMIRLKH